MVRKFNELYDGKLHAQLKMHEGVESRVYLDTEGIETIGVGRNLRDRGLSKSEIDYLLDSDIRICIKELSGSFPWFKELDTVRKRVLVDMMFNLGMPRLKSFVNMLSAIEKEDWAEASSEMLNSVWAEQVGNRSARLSEMMASGEDYIG
jgi:lysozyme